MSYVTAREEQISEIQSRIKNLRQEEIQLAKEIDAHRIAHRPALPTFEQREDIIRGLHLIFAKHSAVENTSHHGDRVSERSRVQWHRENRWMSIDHLAPWGKHKSGPLWHFEDGEIEAVKAVVAEAGHEVVEHWLHDKGLSLKVV